MMDAGHVIDGREIRPPGELVREVRFPWSGEVVGSIPQGAEATVTEAVSAAEVAMARIATVPLDERIGWVDALASKIREHGDVLADLLVSEVGKPKTGARLEVLRLLDAFAYFAREAPLRLVSPDPDPEEPTLSIVREPVGVVAAIVPFNFPVQLLSWKLLPAVLSGCSVVAKPDPRTPLAITTMARWALDCGWPAGVFNVVHGDATTGARLVERPGVAKVAFTGSVRGGRAVYGAAARGIKRVTLELGGCSPLIVWEDADVEGRIGQVRSRALYNAGQYCFRINRVYVHRARYRAFLELLRESVSALRVGDPRLETTELGPLIDVEACEHVVGAIENAERRGARIELDGRGALKTRATLLGPTILADVPENARVMREETFGPVVSVAPIDDLEDALARANATDYGLSAFALAGDPAVVSRLRSGLRAGSVWINALDRASMAAPFGGVKQSGIGIEKSQWAFDEYLQPRSIYCAPR